MDLAVLYDCDRFDQDPIAPINMLKECKRESFSRACYVTRGKISRR